jgi:ATP-binding cassette subfamily F protein 3
MLRLQHVNKYFGNTQVLSDISFTVEEGEKAAIVGANGAGKTTLLKIIAGIEEYDSGKLEFSEDTTIGYVSQDTGAVPDEIIRAYLNTDGSKDTEVAIMLNGFGLEKVALDQSMTTLSSGQKTKIALIRMLLSHPSLLLLDEPTNNLDLPALIWLEDYLQKTSMSAIIISHDRKFLDKITTKIIEIDRESKKVKVTKGKYSDYLEMNLRVRENLKVAHRLQKEHIERLAEEAQQKRRESTLGAQLESSDNDKMLRGFNRDKAGKSARRAKVIEKRIVMMDKIEKPIDREVLDFVLKAPKHPGTLHVTLEEAEVGYESFRVGPLSLDIPYGNRVGIMGLNGSGKSTLLKAITHSLPPLKGKVSVGSGVIMGNMMQEHESLPRDKTLLAYLKEKTNEADHVIYEVLVRFGFTSQQIVRTIGVLSPGSKARLILAQFLLTSVNVLLLDEPTNHLDMEAIQALEEALTTFTGTVILVSHDRYFVEKARLDNIYVLEEGKLRRIPDYAEYVEEAEKRAKKLIRLI